MLVEPTCKDFKKIQVRIKEEQYSFFYERLIKSSDLVGLVTSWVSSNCHSSFLYVSLG